MVCYNMYMYVYIYIYLCTYMLNKKMYIHYVCILFYMCIPLKSDDPAASRGALKLYTCKCALGGKEGRCKLAKINGAVSAPKGRASNHVQIPQTALSSLSQTEGSGVSSKTCKKMS